MANYPTPPCNCIKAPCDCDGKVPGQITIGIGDMKQNAANRKGIDYLKQSAEAPVPIVNNYYLTSAGAADGSADADADGETTIFGLKPIYAIGIGLAALFLFSSTDGKK